MLTIMWKGKRPEDDYNFYSLAQIVQAGMRLQRDIDSYLESFELSFGRFSIMLSILEAPSKRMGVSELAVRNGVSKATTSKMVKRLVGDGIAEPLPGGEDGRMTRIGLTRAGMETLKTIIPGYLERMRIIGANVSIAEKKALMGILGKLVFLEGGAALSRFEERPISEKAEEIKRCCEKGEAEDIDRVMAFLDETADLPTTRVVDYYLGTVKTMEGVKRIEHFLFEGTQMQRNYCTLYFARNNDWKLVDKAYRMGLIDYVQAYSK